MKRAHRDLTWKQFLDDKKFADYGQPVLAGFGRVPLNPIRIAVTLAYGLASKEQDWEAAQRDFRILVQSGRETKTLNGWISDAMRRP